MAVGIAVAVVVYAALSMAAHQKRSPPATADAAASVGGAVQASDGKFGRAEIVQGPPSPAGSDGLWAAIAELRDAIPQSEARAVAAAKDGVTVLADEVRTLSLRLDGLEKSVFSILRARDDEARLERLDAQATGLFDKLFFAKERDYPDERVWDADYSEWKRCIRNYWAILRGYSEGVGEPFALTEADFGGKNGIPGNPLFARDGMRVQYQIMLVVNERQARLRDSASEFMAERCRPPANPA